MTGMRLLLFVRLGRDDLGLRRQALLNAYPAGTRCSALELQRVPRPSYAFASAASHPLHFDFSARGQELEPVDAGASDRFGTPDTKTQVRFGVAYPNQHCSI